MTNAVSDANPSASASASALATSTSGTSSSFVPVYSDVCSALDALYHPHSDSSLSRRANAYLTLSSQSPAAWSICDALLHDHTGRSIESHYFASTTLRSKVLYSYSDIESPHAAHAFYHSLLSHLKNYNQKIDASNHNQSQSRTAYVIGEAHSNRPLRTSLSLCMATLILRLIISNDSDDILTQLMHHIMHMHNSAVSNTQSTTTSASVSASASASILTADQNHQSGLSPRPYPHSPLDSSSLDSSLLLIDILSEIGEESHNERMDLSPEQRNTLYHYLTNFAPKLIKFLSDSLELIHSHTNAQTQSLTQAKVNKERIFHCLVSWVKNQCIDANSLLRFESTPTAPIANSAPTLSPLLESIYEAIASGDESLVTIACDALIELIRQSVDLHAYGAFQHVSAACVTQRLRPVFDLYAPQCSDDDDAMQICRKIMHVWTAICEDYTDFVLSMTPLSAELLESVLHCMQPTLPMQLIDGCFNVWYMFADIVAGVPPSHSDYQKLHEWLAPFYARALDLTLHTLTHMNQTIVTYKNDSSQDTQLVDEARRLRSHAMDFFQDCSTILGIDAIIDYVFQRHLQPAYSAYQQSRTNASSADNSTSTTNHPPPAWHALESTLCVYRSTGIRISPHESHTMHKVFDLIFTLPMPQSLTPTHNSNLNLSPNQPQTDAVSVNGHSHHHMTARSTCSDPAQLGASALSLTCTFLIGRHTDWLAHHADAYLQPSLQYVIAAMHQPDLIGCSALAFRQICDGCKHILRKSPPMIGGLLKVYETIVSTGRLEQQADEREVIQGIVNCLSTLESAPLYAALHKLTEPIVQQLTLALHQHATQQPLSINVNQVLDRLSEVLHHLVPTLNDDYELICRVIVELTTSCAQLLHSCLSTWLADSKRVEKICRCWKFSLKSSRQHFKPLLPQLMQMCLESFQTLPQSTFLYLMSTQVEIFASDVDFVNLMRDAVYEPLMDVNVKLLQPISVDTIRHQPDLCEDLFEFLARMCSKMPQLIYLQKHRNQTIALQLQSLPISIPPSDPSAAALIVTQQLPLISTFVHIACHGLAQSHRESLSSITHFLTVFIGECIDSPRSNARRQSKPPPTPYVECVRKVLTLYQSLLIHEVCAAVCGAVSGLRCNLIVPVIESLLQFDRLSSISLFTLHLNAIDFTLLLPSGLHPAKVISEFITGLNEWTEAGHHRPKSIKDIVEHMNRLCRPKQ